MRDRKVKKNNRFTELDSLRGIASCLVLMFHYSGFPGFDLSFLYAGVTGVDLFFLISGFVILMSLERVSSAWEFIISRISRIYPSFLVMMAITIFFTIVFGKSHFPSVRNLVANISMMPVFFKMDYVEDAYWTLTIEVQFYMFMLILYLAGKIKHIEFLGILFVGAILVYHLIARRFPDSKFYIIPRSYFPFISHFQLFFAGMVFYKMRTTGASIQRHFYILICFICSVILYRDSGKSHFFILQSTYSIMVLIYLFIFYLFVFKKLQFISVKPLIFLGAISYCLYLIHDKAGILLYSFITAHFRINLIFLTLLIIAFMIGLSATVTYLIEIPAIRFMRNNLKRTKNHVTLQS